MTIEIKRNAEETIIELVGRLDTTTAPALDKTINNDIEGTKSLILKIQVSPSQAYRRSSC